ncbi:MAG TPA: hypothetical protein VF590_25085 [Isosphaeraceae bacterium]|jgi:hypothetical protein
MAATIPDLWSDDITVKVLTPLAILRSQAGLLSQKTKGRLKAEVTTATSDKAVQHQGDLIAPALRYRHRALAAKHGRDPVYPAIAETECLKPMSTSEMIAELTQFVPREDWRPRAATEQEFVELVGETLRSVEVRSLIQSLIARINEQQLDATDAPAAPGDDATQS